MFTFLIKIFKKFGFEIVESIPPLQEDGSIRIFAKHPNGFALKFRYRFLAQSGLVSPVSYYFQLFLIREDGSLSRFLLVSRDTLFAIHENTADVNSFKKFTEILKQVSTGFFSRKGVLCTRNACEDLEDL
jgi:hypothetical protein